MHDLRRAGSYADRVALLGRQGRRERRSDEVLSEVNIGAYGSASERVIHEDDRVLVLLRREASR